MPTNILRGASNPAPARARRPRRDRREILIRIGRVVLRARLLDTPTADRVWAALPLYGTANVWGAAVEIATPLESGRERGARQAVRSGEIAFRPEAGSILIVYGRTPVARGGELRLPSPGNIWAEALDDVAVLSGTRPGDKASILHADS
jgi:hypothetical protein